MLLHTCSILLLVLTFAGPPCMLPPQTLPSSYHSLIFPDPFDLVAPVPFFLNNPLIALRFVLAPSGQFPLSANPSSLDLVILLLRDVSSSDPLRDGFFLFFYSFSCLPPCSLFPSSSAHNSSLLWPSLALSSVPLLLRATLPPPPLGWSSCPPFY